MDATARPTWTDNPRPRVATKRRWWWVWALAALGVAVSPIPSPSAQPRDRHVRLEASRGGFHPGVLRVNPGDRVTLEVVATDVVHGVHIDGYGLHVTADPGQAGVLTFVADRSGSFRLRCSVACGPLHPFLIGKMRVGPNTLFWRVLAFSVLLAGAAVWSFRR